MTFEHVVDLVQAVSWPLVALAALIMLRPVLPSIAGHIGRRTTKISVFQLAVEFAPAAPPDDARPPAVALMGAPLVGPSLLPALITELQKRGRADYMVIDLLDDRGWLTSRLFLWADLLPRTRGLRCFVFLCPADGVRRFVALATPGDVRWALARRYPWLEVGYASAYAQTVDDRSGDVMDASLAGLEWEAARAIAEGFVGRVQAYEEPSTNPDEWVCLGDTWEHAKWIRPNALEALLGGLLSHEAAEKTLATDDDTVAIQVSRAVGQYVAIVDGDRRLVGVADRGAALDPPDGT